MKNSIVLSTQPAKFQAATFKGDLDTNMASIASMGYQGVELAIRDPQLINLEELDDLTKTHGLEVPALGTGQAWGEEGLSFTDPNPAVQKAAIARVKSHIPVAAHFDAVIIIGLLRGIVKPGVDQAQAMEWLIAALAECCAEAAKSGVRIALEPITRTETTLINNVPQGLELIKGVGAENFGLLLDTYHMNIEEEDINESIASCGERIFHFHVADSNRWYPGAGNLDFGSILESLFKTGYQGYVSGEFLPEPDANTAARKSIVHLNSLL